MKTKETSIRNLENLTVVPLQVIGESYIPIGDLIEVTYSQPKMTYPESHTPQDSIPQDSVAFRTEDHSQKGSRVSFKITFYKLK